MPPLLTAAQFPLLRCEEGDWAGVASRRTGLISPTVRPDPGKTGAGATAVAGAREPEAGGVAPEGAGLLGTPREASAPRYLRLVLRPSLAGAMHLVAVVGALAFWAWRDRGLWFFGDEWDFLVDRGLGYSPGSTHGIWFPHNEHWSTLPILAWRAIYSIWHLSSYWPYLALLFAVQALVLHLAWRACRRAGADPWVSAAATLMLGLLGAGAADFGWAFQVGFVGSVAFGLLALDMLDRPAPALASSGLASAGLASAGPASSGLASAGPASAGPASSGLASSAPAPSATASSGLAAQTPGGVTSLAPPPETGHRPRTEVLLGVLPAKQDLAPSAALLASLMCSTIGDAMVAGAAVLAFARLPWRRAVRLLWPPVACYLVWFAGVGRLGITGHSDHFDLTTFTSLPGYVWNGLSSALGNTFNYTAAGPALLAGLIVWVAWHGRRLWSERPALLALCASALSFYALAAVGRDISGGANASRYIYVAIAILLPLVAVVLTGWQHQGWVVARVGAAGLLLFTTLGNIGQADAFTSAQVALTSQLKTQLQAVGELVASGVPDVSGPAAAPIPGDPNLQVANIALLEKEHLLARPHLSALDRVDARAVLALGVWDGVNMTLSHKPISRTPFQLVRTAFATKSTANSGCATFTPQTINPAMQIWLRVPAGANSASVLVEAGQAPAGAPRDLGASLAQGQQAVFGVGGAALPKPSGHSHPLPPGAATGPKQGAVAKSLPSLVSQPVELTVPGKGTGYVDDNDPGSLVALTWDAGTPLSLCGLLA